MIPLVIRSERTRILSFWFPPIFASPARWEQNYDNDKNHGTDNNSLKLLANGALIVCHSPTHNYERDHRDDGPPLLPAGGDVSLCIPEYAVVHCHSRITLYLSCSLQRSLM
jgi:hypothetical protein